MLGVGQLGLRFLEEYIFLGDAAAQFWGLVGVSLLSGH